MQVRENRKECEKDGGDLATFWNDEEKKYFQTSKYDGFRFGYRRFRKDKGKFLNVSFSVSLNGEIS